MSKTENVVFRPVGRVRNQASDDDIRAHNHEFEATVEVFPEFSDALEGLHGFSHVIVLTYLNKLRPEQIGPLKVRPRRFLRKGFKLEELPLVGVFALDSPTRPNPIGLSVVKLLRIEANNLIVYGLDCFDGTPVLDVKPYRDSYRPAQFEVADWYRELLRKAGGDV
jgi:tRNA-Thr(GGU) m(6)t(6)A37 methyltransferase TsaA